MENSALTKGISDVALIFLFPFFLAIGHLSSGWNNEEIKKQDKVVLSYQVYLPELKDSKKTVPVVIVLKDRGGRLTSNEVKLIEARSQATGKAVVIPKSPGKDWSEEDSVLIGKLLADLTVKKALNLEQIELVSLSSGAPVAVRFLCTTSVKFEKVYILGHKGEIKNCEGGAMQNIVYTNNDINNNFWKQKTKVFNKISAKNLSEVLKD